MILLLCFELGGTRAAQDIEPIPKSILPPSPKNTLLSVWILNKLALLPALWPKQVALTQKFVFAKIKDGIATGTVEAPSGTIVDVIAVKGRDLIVSYLNNKAEIDAAITDIGDRVDSNLVLSTPLPASPTTNSTPTYVPK